MTPSPSDYPLPQQPPSNNNKLWLGVLVAGAFFCCLVPGGCFAYFASGPEGGVRASNQLSKEDLEHIREHVTLATGEEIISYYDDTISIDGTEAVVLTGKRLVTWNPAITSELALADIESIVHESDPIMGELLDVTGKSGTILHVELAPLNEGPRFVEALERASGVTIKHRKK